MMGEVVPFRRRAPAHVYPNPILLIAGAFLIGLAMAWSGWR